MQIDHFIYIYIYIKSATLAEGDPRALFSLATTPGVEEGASTFSGLLYSTLDCYLMMLSFKQGGIKHHFFFF